MIEKRDIYNREGNLQHNDQEVLQISTAEAIVHSGYAIWSINCFLQSTHGSWSTRRPRVDGEDVMNA